VVKLRQSNGKIFLYNETPRSKLQGISTKDLSNNNAASSGVFTLSPHYLPHIDILEDEYQLRCPLAILTF
jgi:hypothetical protein